MNQLVKKCNIQNMQQPECRKKIDKVKFECCAVRCRGMSTKLRCDALNFTGNGVKRDIEKRERQQENCEKKMRK